MLYDCQWVSGPNMVLICDRRKVTPNPSSDYSSQREAYSSHPNFPACLLPSLACKKVHLLTTYTCLHVCIYIHIRPFVSMAGSEIWRCLLWESSQQKASCLGSTLESLILANPHLYIFICVDIYTFKYSCRHMYTYVCMYTYHINTRLFISIHLFTSSRATPRLPGRGCPRPPAAAACKGPGPLLGGLHELIMLTLIKTVILFQ